MARFVGVAALIVLAAPAAAQQRFVNVDTAVVMPTLQALADTATQEYGRCLYGGALADAADDSLYFIDVALPPVAEARAPNEPRTSITFACRSYGLVGAWHNHVLAEYVKLPPGPWSWPEAPVPAAQACQLSRDDLVSAMRPTSPPITVISVNNAVFCWWFKAELLAKYAGGPYPIAVRPDSTHLRTDWPSP